MKKDDIQHLLKKYQEGSISDAELSELNILTRKNEVMDSAFARADGIIRRRRIGMISMVMTGMMVIGAGVWVMSPKSSSNSMVAMAQEIPAAEDEVMGQDENTLPVMEKAEEAVHVVKAQPEEKVTNNVKRATPARANKPVVVCNTQCDADAVISDIWKFLSV